MCTFGVPQGTGLGNRGCSLLVKDLGWLRKGCRFKSFNNDQSTM